MDEVWKSIKNYENKYFVSNLGRIKNNKGIILKPQNSHGYLRYTLWKNNKNKLFLGHVLVMKAFKPLKNYDNLEINHINGIKNDNRLINLEWCTHKENMQHAVKNNLFSKEGRIISNKNLVVNKKRKVIQLDKNNNFIRKFDSIQEASLFLKCDASSISKICRGNGKTLKGYKWKYA